MFISMLTDRSELPGPDSMVALTDRPTLVNVSLWLADEIS
jgi:hypothetical protein